MSLIVDNFILIQYMLSHVLVIHSIGTYLSVSIWVCIYSDLSSYLLSLSLFSEYKKTSSVFLFMLHIYIHIWHEITWKRLLLLGCKCQFTSFFEYLCPIWKWLKTRRVDKETTQKKANEQIGAFMLLHMLTFCSNQHEIHRRRIRFRHKNENMTYEQSNCFFEEN